MADDTQAPGATKRPLFGSQAKAPESASDSAGTSGGDTAKTADNKPESEVSDKEAEALRGDGGPGQIPAFGKQQGQDENNNLTNEGQLESLKLGASAQSGQVGEGAVDIAGLVAAQSYAGSEAPEDGSTEYVSTIGRLRIGKFEFTNGVLNLKGDDVGGFEKLLETAHPRTQQAVRKIDREAGEAVAKRFVTESKMSRGVDTSDNGPQSPKPAAQ